MSILSLLKNYRTAQSLKSEQILKLLAVLCLVCFAAWAVMAPLDVIVRGRGVLRVEGHNVMIQHPDGGVVEELFVQEGATLEIGDKIAIISNPAINQEFDRSMHAREGLEVSAARLEAEIAGKSFDLKLDDESEDRLAFMAGEKALFEARRVALDEAKAVAQAQVSQRNAALKELEGRIDDLEKQLHLHDQQLVLLEPLVKKGAASAAQLLQLRLERHKVISSLNDGKAHKPLIEAEFVEFQKKEQLILSEFVSDAHKQLAEVRRELAQAEAVLSASKIRNRHSVVTSPIAGVVQKLSTPHAGAVLKPGDTIVEIAPSQRPLVADIRVRPEERDLIWPRMPARLRVMAASVHSKDTVVGDVELISADAVTDEDRQRYYEVTVRLPENISNLRIYPGMAVEAYIVAGQRSIAAYFLKPLFTELSTALGEP